MITIPNVGTYNPELPIHEQEDTVQEWFFGFDVFGNGSHGEPNQKLGEENCGTKYRQEIIEGKAKLVADGSLLRYSTYIWQVGNLQVTLQVTWNNPPSSKMCLAYGEITRTVEEVGYGE